MTQLEQLERLVSTCYPTADTDIDDGPNGRGWLNVRIAPYFFVVEHQPRKGFSFDAVRKTGEWSGYGENFSPAERTFKAMKRDLLRLIAMQLRSKRTARLKPTAVS